MRRKIWSAIIAVLTLLISAEPSVAFETKVEPVVAVGTNGPHPAAPRLADVDLFPSQNFESLGPQQAQVPPPPLDEPPPVQAPPPPPPEEPLPFTATATWEDSSGTTFVVDGLGKTFLFCTNCHAPGAVHPGEAVADGYRLEELDGTQAVVLMPDGKKKHMPLMSTAH